MPRSRGELKIADILRSYDLHFAEEYSFPDLVTKTGTPLRFDFAVFDDEGDIDFLIEYQGIQHYQPRSKFGGSKGFEKQKYNDNRKRVYCAKNRIKLIAIPYWDEPRINYDYIMKAAGY